MIPSWVLLAGVIVLLLLAVGIFAVVIIYLGKGQSNKRPEPVAVPPQVRERAAVEASTAAPPIEAPAHPGEVMRVIRDQETSRLLVEVQGRRYASIREIDDAQTGRRVLWAIADLVRFTGGMATNPQAMRTIGEPPLAAANPSPAAAAAPPVQVPPPARPPVATVSSLAEPERPRYSMSEFFRRGFQPSDATASPTSFIDEIDEILQGYLESMADRPAESVHVLSGEEGTLRIEVGNTRYESVDEVPSPEVRQLIRAAVAEWERR